MQPGDFLSFLAALDRLKKLRDRETLEYLLEEAEAMHYFALECWWMTHCKPCTCGTEDGCPRRIRVFSVAYATTPRVIE